MVEYIGILFIIWASFGLVAAGIAVSKGGSGIGWFILGMIFGPLAWLAVAVKAPANATDSTPRPASQDDRYPCPYCAELIKVQARVCRFCSATVDPRSGESAAREQAGEPESVDSAPDGHEQEPRSEYASGSDTVFTQVFLLVRYHLIAGLVVNSLLFSTILLALGANFYIIVGVSFVLALHSGWLVGNRIGIPKRAWLSGAMIPVFSVLLPSLIMGRGLGYFSYILGPGVFSVLGEAGSSIAAVALLIVLSMIVSVAAAQMGNNSSGSEQYEPEA